ncbi:[cytidine(C)-cytidine(C)-adenosine (A)]-adding enzyme [Chlorella sorokiniana]|uniref:[cytidine(C)-cytidine(C)-adenosine (A)]-adding enzyme n=1 Tax=Chlorella sorokiniana TaxID=3076 RepID=A0A2P6THP6_CHLSO|nr:[cytidine(C)-cytidine(C)-adenosine (A)]-adding enzyme [Chlorella sorokiniana]|eukprot:PRW33796.1 [cytidine(C)-cytidine(C)-adenosine (A)]-adding enzyme [Chlorella sorokiniana]
MLGRRCGRLAARLLGPGVTTAPSELLTALSCSALLSSSLEGSSASSLAGCSGGKDGSAASFVSSITSSSSSRGLIHSKHIGWRPFSAAAKNSTAALDLAAAGAADKLPLWRFLRQQGFSEDSMSRLQAAASSRKAKGWGQLGNRTTEQKLQRDLAPNIAALRADGLDTPSIERLFLRRLKLLTTTHATFSSALAAMRRLAALLPDDPRAVQAPLGATQLGVALWLYPTASARMLARANLASLIEGSLRLRRQLGIGDATAAAGLFKGLSALVINVGRAEVMVAHLQRLQASGELSAEQVPKLALSTAINLSPAEFDRRRQEGGTSALSHIGFTDPAGRQQAAAEALGELLQAAEGVLGPLQPQYVQQGEKICKSL